MISRSMHVCFLTPELPPYRYGGIGRYVLTLASGLSKRGFKITIVGPRIHRKSFLKHEWGESFSLNVTTNYVSSILNAKLFQCVYMDKWPLFWRFPHFCSSLPVIGDVLAVRAWFKTFAEKFDIVEVPNYLGHAAFLPGYTKKTIVRLSTSAIDSVAYSGNWVVHFLEKLTCHRAAAVIPNSHAIQRRAKELYGERLNFFEVIWHGVEDVDPPSVVLPDDRLVLTFIGRPDYRKGWDLLIKALIKVLPRFPSMVFQFVGFDKPEPMTSTLSGYDKWDQQLEKYQDRLFFYGKTSDANRDSLLAASHWTVIPSRFESFGLIAIESMRVGTPIIASDVGGLAEIAKACPSSILFSPNSADSLVASLDFVAGQGVAFAKKIRPATREAFKKFFTADIMLEKTIAVYDKIFNQS